MSLVSKLNEFECEFEFEFGDFSGVEFEFEFEFGNFGPVEFEFEFGDQTQNPNPRTKPTRKTQGQKLKNTKPAHKQQGY